MICGGKDKTNGREQKFVIIVTYKLRWTDLYFSVVQVLFWMSKINLLLLDSDKLNLHFGISNMKTKNRSIISKVGGEQECNGEKKKKESKGRQYENQKIEISIKK